MSDNFYLSFGGEGLEELKSALQSASTLETLELERLTPEIVDALIAEGKPIETLIIEEAFVDGQLLTELLTTLSIGELIFPGYDACANECSCEECECELPLDEEKEEKKKESKEGQKKFKGLDLNDEEILEGVVEEILDESITTIKFKGCPLPEEFVMWMLTELNEGDLAHIETISISKDPKTLELLDECDIPEGITIEPKKKDGVIISKN